MGKHKARIHRYTDLDGVKWWVIDAETALMTLIRAVCPQAQASRHFDKLEKKYTTLPFLLSDTVKSAVNLDWILYRFAAQTDVSIGDLEYISECKGHEDKKSARRDEFEANQEYTPSEMIRELRGYQKVAVSMAYHNMRILIADALGGGKTEEAIGSTCFEDSKPVLIIAPGHICKQWEERLHECLFLPNTEILRGTKPSKLDPEVEYYITSYNRINGWLDELVGHGFKTLILDEAHELRHYDTKKRDAASMISERVERCIGLSATPIFNLAGEIHSVMDVIAPGCLGYLREFQDEWCSGGKRVMKPDALGRHLREQGLFIRRTTDDMGLKVGEVVSDVVTVEASIEELQKIEDVAKVLAQRTLLGTFNDAGQAAREFDAALRMATGVAKARPVGEFVRQLLEGGAETVLVATHHHAVNDIVAKELAAFKPVFYNGRCTEGEKHTALGLFRNHRLTGHRVLVMHLRSGQGIDGLQEMCNHIVFGELDWSPAVHAQFAGRLGRPGQKKVVYAYYITINDGADPSMIDTLGVKKSQRDGLVDLKAADAFNEVPTHRIAEMAAAYLEKRKASVFDAGGAKPTSQGLDLAAFLSAIEYPIVNEMVMQEAIWAQLKGYAESQLMDPGREVVIGPESRIDFLIDDIGVECKVGGDRSAVYRQLKRYSECPDVNEIILVCPWPLASFGIDGIFVHVVTYNGKQLS